MPHAPSGAGGRLQGTHIMETGREREGLKVAHEEAGCGGLEWGGRAAKVMACLMLVLLVCC